MANEDAVVAQGLECCLCFEYFKEPKMLSCSHTFCKKCLHRLYACHPDQNQLSCPICRQMSEINDGDISKLQTNIPINSMVENVISATKSCTICYPEVKTSAVQYCTQCDEYMCDPCIVAHGKFKKNAKHDVVGMDDVKRGNVELKRFCTKHPEEEKLYVCTSCNVSICFRCHVLHHGKPDHEIKEVSDYKKTIQKQIESLQTKATTKMAMIEAHSEQLKEQRAVVEVELDKRMTDINQTYDEGVKRLERQRNNLIVQCKQERASYIAQFEKIMKSKDEEKSCIRSASELVGNGVKTLLEGQTLAVHNAICCALEKMLDESNPDATEPESIADRAKRVKFIKSGAANLGDFRTSYWKLENVRTFPLTHGGPWDAVPLPDGRVAIGLEGGKGIAIFTVDGPQETVLTGVSVQRNAVLPADGRNVVRDLDNKITLYTRAWERLGYQFNTFSYTDGSLGGMCVDRSSNIYVGYSKMKCIDVFCPEGRFQRIQCHGYEPKELSHMNHSKRLVVCDEASSVRVIEDVTGTIVHHIQVDGYNSRIGVLKDDTILISCKKGSMISIELYTNDLVRIRTVLRDFPMPNNICKLLELTTGEIVFVEMNKVFVFHKIDKSTNNYKIV